MPRIRATRGRRPTRRTVLAVLGTGTVSLGGCLSAASRETSTPETTATTHVTADLPEGQFVFVVAGMVGEETRFERSARFTLVKRTAPS